MTEFAFGVFGEIAIIVVGVLLALAVDHWKQGRNDRQSEQRLLRGLTADLEQTVTGLQGFQEELKADVDATESTKPAISRLDWRKYGQKSVS